MSWSTLIYLALSLLVAPGALVAVVSLVALTTKEKVRRRTALTILRIVTRRPEGPQA